MGYYRFGIKLAIVFFVIGTIILIVFAFTLSSRVALFAYEFTITAILISWIYAAMLLFNLLNKKISMLNLFKTLLVMSANIPIGILYAYLMVVLLSYARITFVNDLPETITEIKVHGCEEKKIPVLEQGGSETLWIKISTPCKVSLEYQSAGITQTKNIEESFLPEKGRKFTYKISE